jgi:twinkle protein
MLSTHSTDSESEFLHHEPCPSCGSSDARGVFSDGHTYCFACREHTSGSDTGQRKVSKMTSGLLPFGEYRSLPKRGISEETCRKFGYTIGTDHGALVQIAPYYDKDGNVVAQKIRGANKSFRVVGDMKAAGLFGQQLWGTGGKMLVITEGELDALSMSQVQGNRFPVVSIKNGAQSAKKEVASQIEWVESFDKVIIMFDMDEAGRTAAIEVANLFSPSKAHIASLPLKDASEMLVAGRSKELIDAMWQAKVYRPDGIVSGTDLWEKISEESNAQTVQYPWPDLNKKTKGLRRGELVTFTAGSGVGKSQVCREIAYHLIKEGETIGYIALEENVKRTSLGLMGLAIDKPLHLSREGVDDATLRSAFDSTVGSGRVYLYDHFGSLASDNLLNKIRYLSKSCNVGWVILDHLSIVVSGLDDGDERRLIDNTMTALRSLVEETGIGLILVSHLRRPSGDKGWEEGLQTSLNALRGSAAIAQLSDMCIGVERNQQGDNPNEATLRILKNRFSGETGVGCVLTYHQDTGRMTQDYGAGAFDAPAF